MVSVGFKKHQNQGGSFPSPAPSTGHNFSGKHIHAAPRRIWLLFFSSYSSFVLLQWSYESRISCYGRIKTPPQIKSLLIMNYEFKKKSHTLVSPPTILVWVYKCIYAHIKTTFLFVCFTLVLISVLFYWEWPQFHSHNWSLPGFQLIKIRVTSCSLLILCPRTAYDISRAWLVFKDGRSYWSSMHNFLHNTDKILLARSFYIRANHIYEVYWVWLEC